VDIHSRRRSIDVERIEESSFDKILGNGRTSIFSSSCPSASKFCTSVNAIDMATASSVQGKFAFGGAYLPRPRLFKASETLFVLSVESRKYFCWCGRVLRDRSIVT